MSREVKAWVVPGRAGVLAVIDGEGVPRIARMWAARFLDDDVIEIHVQRDSARPVLEALSTPRRGALNLIEVTTYRSRMFKGHCVLGADPIDDAATATSIEALGHAFQAVGLTADATSRMLAHANDPRAMIGIRLTVESVFDQSPKPGAGARL